MLFTMSWREGEAMAASVYHIRDHSTLGMLFTMSWREGEAMAASVYHIEITACWICSLG